MSSLNRKRSKWLEFVDNFPHLFQRLEKLYSFSTERWKAEVKGRQEWSKGEENR